MADKTGIQWTDATWNPLAGCSIVSPGCTHCYAMAQAARIVRCSAGLGRETHYADTVTTVKGKPVWTGEVRLAPDHVLTQPLRWRRPRRIFVNSMSDLFHEAVPDEWIDRVFAVMALAPQHTFQVLTKRTERMRDYVLSDEVRFRVRSEYRAIDASGPALTRQVTNLPVLPLRNLWIGVTAEDQIRADERIPILLDTPAAKRFVSVEPMLGEVNLESWLNPNETCTGCDDGFGFGNQCKRDDIPRHAQCPWKRAVQIPHEHGPYDADGAPSSITNEVVTLDWVICGGESGPDARPMHPGWARSLRDQCASAGVPFFFKQWGEWGAGDIQAPIADYIFAMDDGTFRAGSRRELPTGEKFETLFRVGKARAGRQLDGVEHNAFPE